MKKALSLLIAGLVLAGGTASPAFGTHDGGATPTTPLHQMAPTDLPVPGVVKTVCTLQAAINLSPGIGLAPVHNEYVLVGTTVSCPNIVVNDNLSGDYDVFAAGATDGPSHGIGHGETCAAGWSQGPNGGASDAFAVTRQSDGKTVGPDAWVKFIRVGARVTAWGFLPWTDGKKPDHFIAELVLSSPCPGSQATLSGIVAVFNPVAVLPNTDTGSYDGSAKTDGVHLTPPTNIPLPGFGAKAVCAIDGDVAFSDGAGGPAGVSDVPAHNHYQLAGATMDCPVGLSNLAGTYDVTASGGTDGPPTQPCATVVNPGQNCDGVDVAGTATVAHGETCAAGWSWGTGFGASSSFAVTKQGGGKATGSGGYVKFIRVGSRMTAWGYLPWTDQKPDYFLAELVLSPGAADIAACLPTHAGKIEGASLTGVALIFNPLVALPNTTSVK